MQLDTHRLQTLGQVREFLDGSQEIDLRPQTRTEAYAFVAETVQRFDYAGRSKADKGLLRRFLTKATDLSRAQVTRLLRQYRTTGEVIDRRGAPRQPFPRRYTPTDIGRLAELDALHGTLSGPTTRKLCARAFHRVTPASNAWPPSPTATCTTCGTPSPTSGAAGRSRPPRAPCR